MNKNKIITWLIIISLLLIGMHLNSNIDILINNEKQIIKEMTQSENEANLQTQIDTLNLSHNQYATNVENYKKAIAEAITNEGITTLVTDSQETVVANIGKIFTTRTSDATATADNISKGKTAYVNGELIVGTGADNDDYYNKGMQYAQNVLYNGQKNYISHVWSSGTKSASLSNETNHDEQTKNYSGTSENIPLTNNDSLLMSISVPVKYYASNSYGSSSGTISLYDANGNLLDSVSGSSEAKFAMAEYDISTSYVYLKFSTRLYVRKTNTNSTKSTVSFTISDISCLYKSQSDQ